MAKMITLDLESNVSQELDLGADFKLTSLRCRRLTPGGVLLIFDNSSSVFQKVVERIMNREKENSILSVVIPRSKDYVTSFDLPIILTRYIKLYFISNDHIGFGKDVEVGKLNLSLMLS